MARLPRLLLDDLVFPEGPRWHEGRLWFSDMHAHEVVAVDLEGNRETIVSVPNRPSGLGWLPDGRLLIVSMADRRLLCFDAGRLSEFADMSALATFPCNDMVVDHSGRAYVGNFGFEVDTGRPEGTVIVMVTPSGEVRVAAEGLMFPNGTVITPDGGTLIIAETFGRRLTAFDLAEDGSLSNRRVWAQLNWVPDGIALDAEGCIWVAVPAFQRSRDDPPRPGGFLRVAEGGEIREQIDLEDRGGFACMLGGKERKHLFLLESFTHRLDQIRGPGNGRIRVVEVEVPGTGLP